MRGMPKVTDDIFHLFGGRTFLSQHWKWLSVPHGFYAVNVLLWFRFNHFTLSVPFSVLQVDFLPLSISCFGSWHQLDKDCWKDTGRILLQAMVEARGQLTNESVRVCFFGFPWGFLIWWVTMRKNWRRQDYLSICPGDFSAGIHWHQQVLDIDINKW